MLVCVPPAEELEAFQKPKTFTAERTLFLLADSNQIGYATENKSLPSREHHKSRNPTLQ